MGDVSHLAYVAHAPLKLRLEGMWYGNGQKFRVGKPASASDALVNHNL